MCIVFFFRSITSRSYATYTWFVCIVKKFLVRSSTKMTYYCNIAYILPPLPPLKYNIYYFTLQFFYYHTGRGNSFGTPLLHSNIVEGVPKLLLPHPVKNSFHKHVFPECQVTPWCSKKPVFVPLCQKWDEEKKWILVSSNFWITHSNDEFTLRPINVWPLASVCYKTTLNTGSLGKAQCYRSTKMRHLRPIFML